MSIGTSQARLGTIADPLAHKTDRRHVSETGGCGIVVGPCRVGREHVYYPTDNPDRKWRLELLNRLFNYLSSAAVASRSPSATRAW